MDNALTDFHSGLNGSRDCRSAWRTLVDLVRGKGLDHVHVWFGTNIEEIIWQSTCPHRWFRHHLDKGSMEGGALWRHCMDGYGIATFETNGAPLAALRDDETAREPETAPDRINFGSGVGSPVFLPDGRRSGGVALGIKGPLSALRRINPKDIIISVMAATAFHTKAFTMRRLGLDAVHLTRREQDCMLWLARGLRSKEIADRTRLSDYTVNFHLRNAKAKLESESREQAVARAVALGLIAP